MKKEIIGSCTLYNADCMKIMVQYPDKYFSLAIVDPPYGINKGGGKLGGDKLAVCKNYKPYVGADKESPPIMYFEELRRISKNQIIFGANHFISKIPIDSSCWIFWDKDNSGNFADGELAWTSFKTAVRKFCFRWNGMLQGDMKNKEIRIHPNQKPVALYKWILSKYAKQGDKIIDTHLGSGSIGIACIELGFELTACEIDKNYFQLACKRLKGEQNEKD